MTDSEYETTDNAPILDAEQTARLFALERVAAIPATTGFASKVARGAGDLVYLAEWVVYGPSDVEDDDDGEGGEEQDPEPPADPDPDPDATVRDIAAEWRQVMVD